MRRIVGGEVFEGKPSNDRFDLAIHDFGNGQREAVVSRCTDWAYVGPAVHLDFFGQPLEPAAPTEDELEDSRQANRQRSARRAKTRMRRVLKAIGADCMLTLTYRANQTDRDLLFRHLKEFVRRVRRACGDFAYAAAVEPQKRGALHVHMGVRRILPSYVVRGVRVKSFDLLRSIWRSVVGELGGTVNVGKGGRWKRHSPARLAAYLSKYMLKAFDEGDDWSRRYSASKAVPMPEPVRLQLRGVRLAEMIDLAYSEVMRDESEAFTWVSRWGDLFYIATEPEVAPLGWRG